MNKNKISIWICLLIGLFLVSCEEDFDLTMPYTEQAVVYAFLQHKDPWDIRKDTNFILVNKAFIGDLSAESMAAISDSINYPNYSKLEVSLQRIESQDIDSKAIGTPIVLSYMKHPKDSGLFGNGNNIVFYTTAQLMHFQEVEKDPIPNYDNPYFYRLSIKKEGQKEVRSVTKMIRGIIEKRPFSVPENYRLLEFGNPNKAHKMLFQFQSNLDARVYQLFLSFYYYEKRTDDKIYIKKVNLEVPPHIIESKVQKSSTNVDISVKPDRFYSAFLRQLEDTTNVVWRAIKITGTGTSERPETHFVKLVLGTQESYIYNQVTQPSEGVVQEKPLYTNIENGIGLFTSKWEHSRSHFTLTNHTLDSLYAGQVTKNLKFLTRKETYKRMQTMDHAVVIKDY